MTGPKPADRGWRWPAEWEPHTATWLVWPQNPDTWPGRMEAARRAFAVFVRELHLRETVRLLVDDAEAEAGARAALAAAGVALDGPVELHRVPTNDAWVRDTGPVFLVREREGRRERALADFRFDSWGGKYPPWDLDDAVPAAVGRALDLPRFRADFVLEGGSVDGNGAGCVLTTEACLLQANRERGRSLEQMERRLAGWLGARHVVWLADGIAGDDTDGHVDDCARFLDARTVVAAVESDAADENFAPLAENRRRLGSARDAAGRPLDVIALPMPPPLRVSGQRCPASYANFYLANDCALVPVFGAASDERALATLREALPGRDVVGIPATDLVVGLGALHCLSQQEPAVTAARGA